MEQKQIKVGQSYLMLVKKPKRALRPAGDLHA